MNLPITQVKTTKVQINAFCIETWSLSIYNTLDSIDHSMKEKVFPILVCVGANQDAT